jgi:hypothetical protein
MPFLVVMPRPQAIPAYTPDLHCLHGHTSDNLWIGGVRNSDTALELLLARRWNGTAWENHDPLPALAAGPVVGNQIYGDTNDNAWLWTLGNRIAYWDGAVWTDLGFASGQVFAPGPGMALDAPRAFQVSGATPPALTWHDWTGSAFGAAQSASPVNNAWTSWNIGPSWQFSVTNQLAIGYDAGQYFVMGGGSRTTTPAHGVTILDEGAGTLYDLALFINATGLPMNAVYTPPSGAALLLWNQTGATPPSRLYRWSAGSNAWFAFTDGLPDIGSTGAFIDLHGVGDGDFWLIGVNDLDDAWYFAHYNGADYDLYLIPDIGGGNARRIWCVATDDVWAIGTSDAGETVWHWDGAAWAVHTVFTS